MPPINPQSIPQLRAGFTNFVQSEALGAPFKNVRFKGFVYNFAKVAYQDGWITGLKEGWAQVNSDHQKQVTERHRTSFIVGQIDDARYTSADSGVAPPRTTLPPAYWLRPLLEKLVPTHVNIMYPGYYRTSNFSVDSDAWRIERFYASIMAKSWRHGWYEGDTEARSQYRQRISDPAFCPVSKIEAITYQQEVAHIERLAGEMFGYAMPLEGWGPLDDADDDELYLRRRASPRG